MSEQAHPMYNKLRAVAVAAGLIGTLAVGACTSTEAPRDSSGQAAAHLADKLPTVDSAASTLPLDQYGGQIDMANISREYSAPPTEASLTDTPSTDAATDTRTFQEFQNIHPVTKEETSDFPYLRSAPILDVMLGSDSKLHFKDHTPEYVSSEESKILAAVKENTHSLTAAMKAGTVDTVSFRVNEPLPGDAGYEDTSYPIMISQDVHEGAPKPVAYYFLPGRGQVDTKTLATMTSHEAAHGMLKHGLLDLKTGETQTMFTEPGERETFTSACADLRKNISEDVRMSGWMVTSMLGDLRDAVPRKYRKVIDEVRDAFSEGTYYKLPTVAKDESEVPTCDMQNPLRTIRLISEQRGINTDALSKALDKDSNMTLTAEIMDEWNGMLERESLLSTLCESQYLPFSMDQEDAGHPQDGIYELMASTYSITMNYPVELGQNIRRLQPEQQEVIFKVIDGTFTMLKSRYADNADYIKQIEERQAAVHAAAK